jgi:hypothetical protein
MTFGRKILDSLPLIDRRDALYERLIWGQFHQHFTPGFFVRMKVLRKAFFVIEV